MTKNPGWTPSIRQANWASFTQLSNALIMAQRVKALAPNVSLVLNAEYIEGGYTAPDPNPDQIAPYVLTGTITAPNGRKYDISEQAGQLWDRQFVPYPDEDKSTNAHNPLGGPNLSWTIDSEPDDQGNGQANLMWTCDPVNAIATSA